MSDVRIEAGRRFLVPVMSARQRVVFAALLGLWFAALTYFWRWWLQSGHVVTPFGMVVNSAMFVWTLFLPGVFFLHLARMARPNPALGIPELRVAIIVTKAPSEPWEVVARTLRAMLRQDLPYAYDVWLADEAPSAETLRWCEANGVRVSTRHGRADYHRTTWPRRTKSKEGNLAFFYDHVGYRDYDVVAQLDADHRPTPGYLREMVRPFADPRVGYVAAPSICDANARTCWAARGRLFKEAVFHGPQQAGGHHAIPPVCIGSHYAVRTQALQEIGGVGPELAEDFSTSLMMNAFGWRGVFALDAEAHGDGPESFADFVTQEFQWARSLSDVTLHYNRRYWRGLAIGAKIKLGFGEAWYPLYALHMLAAALFPVVALVAGTPWADVKLLDFFAHALVVSAVLLVFLAWVRAQGWFRPADAPLLSWETALFLFTRWPWVLWGVLQSWAGWALRRRFGFKVTPKGIEDAMPIGIRAVAPYLLIAAVCAGTAVFCTDPGAARGYYYFCLLNALVYLVVAGVVIALHLRESGTLTWLDAQRLAAAPVVATGAIGVLVAAAFALRGQDALQALFPGEVIDALGAPGNDAVAWLTASPAGGAPAWLVLSGAAALVAGTFLYALRAADRVAEGDRSAIVRGVDIALFALAGLSGVAFVVLAERWSRGDAIHWTGFAAVLAAAVVVSVAHGARRRRALPVELRQVAATTARAGRPSRPGRGAGAGRSAPTPAQPADVHVGPAPVPPRRRVRSAREQRFARPAAAPAPRTRVSPGELVVAEITWWNEGERSCFTLRDLDRSRDMRLDERSTEISDAGATPRRTDEASRAHAILYDRLVLSGWEPCGRGVSWYAHQFRRTVAPTDAIGTLAPARALTTTTADGGSA
jgi:cellulose synthase/poly-beta-1,6-N-acetylglucosamine synthase-like glycosyltransferase